MRRESKPAMDRVARGLRRRFPLRGTVAAVALVSVAMLALPQTAQARDFLSSFFGSLMGGGRAPAPPIQFPFAEPGESAQPAPAKRGHGGTAYCVRTCDGRYFPLAASGGQSRAEACKSFCPAAETRVVYGSGIDNAATESGKPYSELPNAFRYREELVAGCTCNGKDPGGLARVDIESDPTIRKGDLVAGPDGLVVATSRSSRHGAANYSPASKAVRARFERLPVVAAE
jgi:hypothetical protein